MPISLSCVSLDPSLLRSSFEDGQDQTMINFDDSDCRSIDPTDSVTCWGTLSRLSNVLQEMTLYDVLKVPVPSIIVIVKGILAYRGHQIMPTTLELLAGGVLIPVSVFDLLVTLFIHPVYRRLWILNKLFKDDVPRGLRWLFRTDWAKIRIAYQYIVHACKQPSHICPLLLTNSTQQ